MKLNLNELLDHLTELLEPGEDETYSVVLGEIPPQIVYELGIQNGIKKVVKLLQDDLSNLVVLSSISEKAHEWAWKKVHEHFNVPDTMHLSFSADTCLISKELPKKKPMDDPNLS